MIPLSFDYEVATSSDHALALLAEHGDEAKLLAGGHSLLPLMKLRLAAPSVLVDVGRLHELRYIREENDEIAIGALTRHHDLETDPLLQLHVPVLANVASMVGDPHVRNRGTLGGSVAHGDAASDLPAAVLALDATLVIDGPSGRRSVPASEFFIGFLETALEPCEMLVEIRVPKLDGAGWSYQKVNRRSQDFAIVAAVVVATSRPRIGLVNMGPTPIRCSAIETALMQGTDISSAARLVGEESSPSGDQHASADYRRRLAAVLVERAWTQAVTASSDRG